MGKRADADDVHAGPRDGGDGLQRDAAGGFEEGAVGGFGSYVLHTLAEHDMLGNGLKVRTMVLPDVFIDQDKPDKMYAKASLDAAGISAQVMKALGRSKARVGGRVA